MWPAAVAGAQLRLAGRTTLEVTPSRITLGRSVTLSVRGARPDARYRFVAIMTATGGGDQPNVKGCQARQDLGSGAQVTWTPASGTYRLMAYGPTPQAETDTVSLAFAVAARRVMLASSTSGSTFVLRTDDLGPGHSYQWWMRYSYETGDGNVKHGAVSQPWTGNSNGPMVTYPGSLPSSANVSARVSIYRSDPCAVIAAGAMGPNP
jgi:hypothetical protein